MANAQLNITPVSRGEGYNAVKSAAYIAREKLIEHSTCRVYDFRKQSNELESLAIMALDEVIPERWRDLGTLANDVEEAERKRNSQLWRELRLSIPHELETPAQRIALVHDFVNRFIVPTGMIAVVALHKPGKDNDKRNYHAHVLLTTRRVVDQGDGTQGFDKEKARDWNDTAFASQWRKGWGVMANYALAKAGQKARVCTTSLVDVKHKGNIPTVQLGRAAAALERKGVRTKKGDYNRKVRTINHHRRASHPEKYARRRTHKRAGGLLTRLGSLMYPKASKPPLRGLKRPKSTRLPKPPAVATVPVCFTDPTKVKIKIPYRQWVEAKRAEELAKIPSYSLVENPPPPQPPDPDKPSLACFREETQVRILTQPVAMSSLRGSFRKASTPWKPPWLKGAFKKNARPPYQPRAPARRGTISLAKPFDYRVPTFSKGSMARAIAKDLATIGAMRALFTQAATKPLPQGLSQNTGGRISGDRRRINLPVAFNRRRWG